MMDQKNLNKQVINIGPDEEFVTIKAELQKFAQMLQVST